MFQKLRMKFAAFMYGRYGFDRFSKFLFILFILLWVLLTVITNIFPFLWFLNILEYALFIYTYFRVFSKNISKRAAENRKYMQAEYKVKNFFRVKKSRMQKRKTHHLYKCPKCKQILSVPKGRGKIKITCPKCGCIFTKRSWKTCTDMFRRSSLN